METRGTEDDRVGRVGEGRTGTRGLFGWGAHLRARVRLLGDDSGAATAEYAIATLAAVALASLLVVIMRGDEVRAILTDLVRRALSVDV